MNAADLLILMALIFFGLSGYKRTFIGELFDLTSFFLAFVLSLRFYNSISNLFQNYFHLPHSISTVVGFITVWFFVEIILMLLTQLFFTKIKTSIWFNKLNFLSILPGILKGIVLITIFLIFITSFPIQAKIKKSVDNSKIGSFILLKTQSLEAPLKNVFGGISEDTLTFLTVKPQTNEKISLGFTSANFFPNEILESQMVILLNNERIKAGRKPLVFDPKLKSVARVHSSDMFKRGYFSHYSPEGKNVADRAEEGGVSFLVAGENLAYAPTLQLAHNGLMNSPGHRENILSLDFSRVGIGIMDGKEYGLMITQVFAN